MTAGELAAVILGVPDVAAAQRFYRAVFGPRADDPLDGIAPGLHYRHDPVWPGARLRHRVSDLERALHAVRDSGGQVGKPTEGAVSCRDPFGLPFELDATTAGPPREVRAGDVLSAILSVTDAAATRRFYLRVVGAAFEAGCIEVAVLGGRPGVILTHAAPDLDACLGAVRTAGGDVNPAAGGTALCRDPAGIPFYLRA